MKNVTLEQLKQDIRFQADEDNSEFIQDTNLTRIINLSLSELYDKLVAAYDEDYYQKVQTINLQFGRESYGLNQDFYKLVGVDAYTSSLEKYSLPKYNWNDRNRYKTPNNALISGEISAYRLYPNSIKFIPIPATIKRVDLSYIPVCKTLVNDSDYFDGVNGWEEYVIYDCAIRIMIKGESDPSALLIKMKEINERIDQMKFNRDAGQTETVTYSSGPYEGYDYIGN